MIVNNIDFTLDETLTVYTNGVSKTFTQMAPLKFLPMEVHLNIDSMTNIIAIKDVSSIPGVHISTDLRKERAIIMEYKNQVIKFQECRDGLYYYDTSNKFISNVNSYSFLSTTKYNKE